VEFVAGGDGRTAGDIIAQDKNSSINPRFPSQMRDKSFADIDRLARVGDDKAVQTTSKLLTQNEYNL
jgi:hypothetical protein